MLKLMSWLDNYNHTKDSQYKGGKPLNIHVQCSQSLLLLLPPNQLLCPMIQNIKCVYWLTTGAIQNEDL